MRTEAIRREIGWPILFLLVFLVRGVLAGAVTPPWQAPDEPRHLEYVLTVLTDADSAAARAVIERRLIASLVDYRWWPLVFGVAPPVPLPRSLDAIAYQRGDQTDRQPPGYYHLAAAVLRLAGVGDLVHQLLVTRLVSTLLAGVAVAATYGAGRLIAPARPAVAILAAAFVALAPMTAFIGGAVNNDALAIAVGSLLLAAVPTVLVRPDWRGALGIGLLLLLATTTKSTVAPAALVASATALGVLGRRRFRVRSAWRLISISALVGILLGAAVFEPTEPAGWGGWQSRSPTRIDLPDGSALRVEDTLSDAAALVSQIIPPNRFAPLRGREVIIQAMARCDGPNRPFVQLRATPLVPFTYASGSSGPTWVSIQAHATVPLDARQLIIDLGAAGPGGAPTGVCYFRDVTLVPAGIVGTLERWNVGTLQEPGFSNVRTFKRVDVQTGEAENLVANGNGAIRRLVLRPWTSSTPLRALAAIPGLGAALDPLTYAPRWWPEYGRFAEQAFESAWGKFGWLSIPMSSDWYRVWLVVCLLAALGWLRGLVDVRRSGQSLLADPRRRAVLVYAVAVVVAVVVTWLRFLPITPDSGWPQGRYLFPEIVAFSVLLAGGLARLVPRQWEGALVGAVVGLLLLFDLASTFGTLIPAFYTVT